MASLALAARAATGVSRLVNSGRRVPPSADVRVGPGSRREPLQLKLDAVQLASSTRAAGVFGVCVRVCVYYIFMI